MAGGVTTQSVDYLQRCGSLALDLGTGQTTGAEESRRLLRVLAVSRPDNGLSGSVPRPAADRWRPPAAQFLTGLYGHGIPLAMTLTGTGEEISVALGTWSSRAAPAPVQDRRLDVLRSVLQGAHPGISAEPTVVAPPADWPTGGLALGVPDLGCLLDVPGAGPLDRVIAAMAGTRWMALVLAYPVPEQHLAMIRLQVLNELREVSGAASAEGAPSPLAEHYTSLLGASLAALGEAMATGAWRTGVYLLGDAPSFPRLAAAWRSVFSGAGSLPEPVRVFDNAVVAGLARTWSLPDQPGAPGPGRYRRPYELQTLLSTAQLACYVSLPEREAPGFAVRHQARFDSVTAGPADGLALGQVLHDGRPTAGQYRVGAAALTRHVFVPGVTGAGKTNTILSLLTACHDLGVPFLVVEAAKAEYRTLLAHPSTGPALRVFTAGDDLVSPLPINPFDVPAGTPVSEHLDLVRAAFTVAFGMWTPLPQILERCLHAIYLDRGWDLRSNSNARLRPGEDPGPSFPTLSDLIAKVNEVVPALGYEDRIAGDMRAALLTRLESLRSGGKGAMLDVARSMPDEELFGLPVVVELEALGDDGDKAFIAALLLIRLAEYRRAKGQHDKLVHLLVIEEAHRLLSAPAPGGPEDAANPKGQAVETFSHLLAEVRAYGQGVVIADQVPARLASGVIKNTDLKIAHRLVAADDREVMAGAMVMDDGQARALATLEPGRAAVFGGGDDSPVLVQVPLIKDKLSPVPPSDAEVRGHMAAWRASAQASGLFLPRPFCAVSCADDPGTCAAARRLMADEYLQRTVAAVALSAIEDPDAVDRLWPDLIEAVSARRPPRLDEAALLRAVAGHSADWYAGRRGAQASWSYADTAELGDRLREVLLDKLSGHDAARTRQLRAALRTVAHGLYRRVFEPYPACGQICDQDPPLCLYRSAVADLVATRRHHDPWLTADAADATSEANRRQQTWEVCQDAAYDLIEFPAVDNPPELNGRLGRAARRVGLCYEQQMLAGDQRKSPRTSRRVMARVLAEAGSSTPDLTDD